MGKKNVAQVPEGRQLRGLFETARDSGPDVGLRACASRSTTARIVSASPTRIAAAITVSMTVSRRSAGMIGNASSSAAKAHVHISLL